MYAFHIITPNGDVDIESHNDEICAKLVADLKEWNTTPFKIFLNLYNINESDIIGFEIYKDGLFIFTGGSF